MIDYCNDHPICFRILITIVAYSTNWFELLLLLLIFFCYKLFNYCSTFFLGLKPGEYNNIKNPGIIEFLFREIINNIVFILVLVFQSILSICLHDKQLDVFENTFETIEPPGIHYPLDLSKFVEIHELESQP